MRRWVGCSFFPSSKAELTWCKMSHANDSHIHTHTHIRSPTHLGVKFYFTPCLLPFLSTQESMDYYTNRTTIYRNLAFPGISEGIVMLKRPHEKWTKVFCFLVMSAIFFSRKTFNVVRVWFFASLFFCLVEKEECQVLTWLDKYGYLRTTEWDWGH